MINGVTYPVLPGLTIYGYLFNPQQAMTNYRIDLFVKTESSITRAARQATGAYTSGPMKGQYPAPSQFQSLLVQQGLYGYWGAQVPNPGLVIAVLYPPACRSLLRAGPAAYLPAGWLCHSNTGVGYKLTNYFARIYAKTDVEYLQEDNIPIIVQDDFHARCGSSLVRASRPAYRACDVQRSGERPHAGLHVAGGGLGFPILAALLYRSHFRPALLPGSHA